jgi:hypothetical protein
MHHSLWHQVQPPSAAGISGTFSVDASAADELALVAGEFPLSLVDGCTRIGGRRAFG